MGKGKFIIPKLILVMKTLEMHFGKLDSRAYILEVLGKEILMHE